MSEWQDMKQKPNSKLRDLLKNKKAKTRKLSELSKTEQNRLAKLNAIRSEIERVDDEKKWAALELMLGTSSSVVAPAKKMAKPETKTVTRTLALPKTKIVKQ